MKKVVLLLTLVLFSTSVWAQNIIKAIVKDKATLEHLEGVTVAAINPLKTIATTGKDGQVVVGNLPSGTATIHFSYVGYHGQDLFVIIPDTTKHIILMEKDEVALQDVTVVASTRINDPIENATTKVDVLGHEEMNEESTLKPGNIASILGDMSGIQIQQSSVTSGNSNVRIQGLDGK